MPHEILRMDPADVAIAVACMQQADASSESACKQAFPVVVLGEL